MLEIEFAQLSDPGKMRETNEDFVGYSSPQSAEQARKHGWLFALADGWHDGAGLAPNKVKLKATFFQTFAPKPPKKKTDTDKLELTCTPA